MKASESFSIHGRNLLNKVNELIEEGNATKITITDSHGKEIMSFPASIGVLGALIAPVLAAVGAAAALLGDCIIRVEKDMQEADYDEADHMN